MTSLFRALWSRLRTAPPHAGEHWLTRFVVLRLLGLVYFFAFLSLANQVLPLIGSHGLLPASRYLEAVREQTGGPAWGELPSLFWFSSSDATLQTLAWVGVGLSVPLLAGFANALLLAALWVLYLSFVHVGQVWYGYGWEIQLLETGFLAIFLCPLLDPRPFPSRPPPFPVILCLRWLIVRIMLGAGLIKLRGDPCWRDLTCLLYHYETQPIPNPLSRLLHFLPPWIHRLECLWNHLVELVAPWFAFGPFAARRVAGFLFLAFQLLLILSGNLSFPNYLTIAPALACLDDGVWRRLLPRRLVAAADRARELARPSRAQGILAILLAVVVGVLSYWPVRNLLSSRQAMNTSFNRLHLVNTYGAFGSVGRERDEIVLEGTDEESIGPETRWRAYEFKAKPTDPDRPLPIVSPYHYRVDWQIWFAAMSTPGRHPWLVHLVWKLLHGDPLALSLLANDPFPDVPARFIRADLYRYKFTRPFQGGPFWERTRIGPWLPPMSTDDPRIREFLGVRGLLDEPDEKGVPAETRTPR